jgi:hypothetical protein
MKRFMQRTFVSALALVFPKWINRLRNEVAREEIFRRSLPQIEAEAAEGRLSTKIIRNGC